MYTLGRDSGNGVFKCKDPFHVIKITPDTLILPGRFLGTHLRLGQPGNPTNFIFQTVLKQV